MRRGHLEVLLILLRGSSDVSALAGQVVECYAVVDVLIDRTGFLRVWGLSSWEGWI